MPRRIWSSLSLVIIGSCAALLFGQTAIAHYSAIFVPPFNGVRAKDFTFQKKDGQWYIIAINDPYTWPPLDQPESAGLPVSTSYDLNHWNYQGVAIPHGDTGTWDSRAIWAPSIFQANGTYYLYYTGVQTVNNILVQKIGFATSTDLIQWTKFDSNPVLDCSQFTWAAWSTTDSLIAANCRDPYVIRDDANNRWVMFFSAVSTQPYKGVANPTVIGMATSSDLIHWTDAGDIPATLGYTSESPHVFVHNGTWYLVYTGNCSFQGTTKCLVYSTASSLLGPYSGYSDLPAVDSGGFASEYYQDTDGSEYFAYAASGNVYFERVDWSSGGFGLQPIPFVQSLTGTVWNDVNRNGIQDADEPGINGVAVHVYQDDGDGVFNPTRDQDLYSGITATRKVNSISTPGTYYLSSVAAGQNWLVVGSESFGAGQPLAGLTLTTSNAAASYPVTEQLGNARGPAFGFALPDSTPPASINDLVVE